jgi:hypothetical protein
MFVQVDRPQNSYLTNERGTNPVLVKKWFPGAQAPEDGDLDKRENKRNFQLRPPKLTELQIDDLIPEGE